MKALRMVTSGTIYELGHPYDADMPSPFDRTYSLVLPVRSGPYGANRLVAKTDFMSAVIGQVGTQFDGLGDVGKEDVMDDGSVHDVFFNGFTAEEMDSRGGLLKLGIEHVRPIVTRALLIDIAAYEGESMLPSSYEVTLADVRGALQRQGTTKESIEPGDALFFRYRWAALWQRPQEYIASPPGIGIEVAQSVVPKQVTVVGSDSFGTEVVPSPDPALVWPAHQELLTKSGIFNIENMQFEELVKDDVTEFLFIVTTIPFKGATGSPVRPIAIR
jgi:hypothetical protein